MRLRHTLAATAGAALLILTVPGPAHAAEGDFGYTYTTGTGEEKRATLHDPADGECVMLAEAAREYDQPPAHSPKNRTDRFAIVFTNADCSGDHFMLRPHTGGASERLKLRSVVFV